VTLNLAIGLAQRGFQTDLVLVNATGPLLDAVPPSVRIIDFKTSRMAWALPQLARYLRRERPTALLAALDHANLAALLAARTPGTSTRIVITIHTTIDKSIQAATNFRDRAVPKLLARLQSLADAVVAVSEGTANDFARMAGVDRHRVDVIYNGVITPELLQAAAAPVAHPWFEQRVPVVLGVGRLDAHKNFAALIDAFALVRQRRDSRLLILGEGPEHAALETRVRALGLQNDVLLPGFCLNPYPYMARAAVVAASSEWEGLPTVLIESLALGTPVVSTDCQSGPREVLRGGTLGTLVPVGDIDALAAAIDRTMSTRQVTVAPDALRRFSSDTVLDQYERVLGVG
jgi:glycosyltransferase involved in cell wall biosynthesis